MSAIKYVRPSVTSFSSSKRAGANETRSPLKLAIRSYLIIVDYTFMYLVLQVASSTSHDNVTSSSWIGDIRFDGIPT